MNSGTEKQGEMIVERYNIEAIIASRIQNHGESLREIIKSLNHKVESLYRRGKLFHQRCKIK